MLAPTTTIESVIIVRPLKVVAFLCGVISIIFLLVGVSSSAWVETLDFRHGLFETCDIVREELKVTLQCPGNDVPGWLVSCAALCIVGVLIDVMGTVLSAVALYTDKAFKYKCYRAATAFWWIAVAVLVIALIIFPVMFLEQEEFRYERQWWFSWSYGVTWGGALFLIGAGVLLCVDKETEEIVTTEKVYYHNEGLNA